MIPIFDLRGLDCATLPPALRPQLQDLIDDWTGKDLLDLTAAAILEAHDGAAQVLHELDWEPRIDPRDGTRHGQPGFEPYWLSLTFTDGWYRLDYLVEGTGFLYVLFIDAGNATFGPMCREYVA